MSDFVLGLDLPLGCFASTSRKSASGSSCASSCTAHWRHPRRRTRGAGAVGALEQGREPILHRVDVGGRGGEGPLELGDVLGQVQRAGPSGRAHPVGPGGPAPVALLGLVLGVWAATRGRCPSSSSDPLGIPRASFAVEMCARCAAAPGAAVEMAVRRCREGQNRAADILNCPHRGDDDETRKDCGGDAIEGRDEAAQRNRRLRGRGGQGTGRARRPALRGAPLPAGRRRGHAAEHRGGLRPGDAAGQALRDDELGLEVLCTKAGEGSISVGETVLDVKGAKPLPASD